MLAAGVVGIAAGVALAWFGVCPIVKRIWTPSWAVYSAGWAFLLLGLFYLVADVWRWRRWTYPLVVVGANSILAYCMSMMLKSWVGETVRRHFGGDFYERLGWAWAYLRQRLTAAAPGPGNVYLVFGHLFTPMAEAVVFLLFCWVVCWWLYRNRIFIKI